MRFSVVLPFFLCALSGSLAAPAPANDVGRGINGGIACAACTVLVGVAEQLAEVRNQTVSDLISSRFCPLFPGDFGILCDILVHLWGPALIEKLNRRETPDVVCYSLGICHVDPGMEYCHLFPEPQSGMESAVLLSRSRSTVLPFFHWSFVERLTSACELPGVQYVCQFIEKVLDRKKPLIDFDGDKYSIIETFRGVSWRGRDCDDVDEMVYPGRRPINNDLLQDSNCNGIYGLNETSGLSYEEELCGGPLSPRGLIYIGDSIGAHFHVPPEWLTAAQITTEILKNFSFVLGNELDWPQTSFPTGFLNNTWPVMSGPTDSLYLRLRQRNLCNHRDFQNICVNGADSGSALNNLKTIARNPQDDRPATVLYAMMGNDVCVKWMDSPDDMTTPEQFRSNVESALHTLDSLLPPGSSVLLMGLVNGSFIYEAMHAKLHPLGQLHGDVTYADGYEWFNCMRIGPCFGWMNGNRTVRDITTRRAVELTEVLRDIAATRKYQSFTLHFLDNPMEKVIQRWMQDGHELWTLLEPVDSLHPVQESLPYITRAVWEEIESKFPEVLGAVNPKNPLIRALFGDQGGH